MKMRHLPLGDRNVVGKKVYELRISRKLKQKELMAQLQVRGVDINPSSLSKLEGQMRPVTDIEIIAICEVFNVGADFLLGME